MPGKPASEQRIKSDPSSHRVALFSALSERKISDFSMLGRRFVRPANGGRFVVNLPVFAEKRRRRGRRY